MRKVVSTVILAVVVAGVLLLTPLSRSPDAHLFTPLAELEVTLPELPEQPPLTDPTSGAQSEAGYEGSIASLPQETWMETPLSDETQRALPHPSSPLGREVVFVEDCAVQVQEGWLRIATGVRAQMLDDRGDMVTVRIGKTTMDTPRSTIASIDAPIEENRPALLTGVRGFFQTLFQPLPNSLGIDVKEIGTGRGIDRTWQTSYGSYAKDSYRTKGLAVDVRNVSRQGSGKCQAEVYWLGRRLADRELHIHHGEVIPLEVGAASSVTRRFWCPLASSNATKYVTLGRSTVAGSKLDGWLVVITRDGQILAGRGSGPEQSRIAQSPDELQALVANYTPTGRVATEGMPNWRTDPIRKEWGREQVPQTMND